MFSSPDCLVIRREPHRKYKTSGHQMQIKLKISNFSLYTLDKKKQECTFAELLYCLFKGY